MATTTKRMRKVKERPERRVKIMERSINAEVMAYTVRLTVAGEATDYDVCPGTLQPGVRCWLWRKVLGTLSESIQQEPYAVVLDSDFGSSCTCKGASRWGHCKHLEATQALTLAGQFPDLNAQAAAKRAAEAAAMWTVPESWDDDEPFDMSIPGGST